MRSSSSITWAATGVDGECMMCHQKVRNGIVKIMTTPVVVRTDPRGNQYIMCLDCYFHKAIKPMCDPLILTQPVFRSQGYAQLGDLYRVTPEWRYALLNKIEAQFQYGMNEEPDLQVRAWATHFYGIIHGTRTHDDAPEYYPSDQPNNNPL